MSETEHTETDESAEDTTESLDVEIWHLYRGNREEEERARRATDIRFDVVDGDDELTAYDFGWCYEQVGTDTIDDGRVDSHEEAANLAARQWSTNPVEMSDEYEAVLDQIRSVEPGDIIYIDGAAFLVSRIGVEYQPHLNQ